MPSGTPGFVGARLSQARRLRGLTGVSLADLVGLSPGSISHYEKNRTTPSIGTLERLAQVLNFPIEYFRRPVQSPSDRPIIFRSMSTATNTARNKASERINLLREIIPFLGTYIEFPQLNLPSIDISSSPKEISDSDIENVAMTLRRFWGLGDNPISNSVWLLENNGIIVTRILLEAATLDSLSTWLLPEEGGYPCIVLGDDKTSAVRSRLDAMHELAHLLMHSRLTQKDINDAASFKLIERQAHLFARSFLLPIQGFAADVYEVTLDELRILKDKWRVSIGAMIFRAEDLGLIDSARTRNLWRARASRGWATWEPLDDTLEVERSSLLRRAVELLVEEGIVSRNRLMDELPFPQAEWEKLTNLPIGYLDESPPRIRILEPDERRRKDIGEHSSTPSETQIIPFPKRSS